MPSQTELMDMLTREEALLPELEPYLEEDGTFGPCLRHPLVYQMLFDPKRSGHVNAQYQYKKKALAKAIKEERWDTVVFLHERPYRVDAFYEHVAWACDPETPDYWDLLGSIWTDSENIWQNEDIWHELLAVDADIEARQHMMNEDERGTLSLMPDEFEIYRGFKKDDRVNGLSWTVNRITAKFFATRLAHDDDVPRIATGTISKTHVLARFDGRNEGEIVVLPENVRDITIEVK